MSKHDEGTKKVDGPHPVLSGRVDPLVVGWALKNLGLSRSDLVREAVTEYVTRRMKARRRAA